MNFFSTQLLYKKQHTSIKRNKMEDIEVRQVVTTVYINGLKETHSNPSPHQYNMVGKNHYTNEETQTKNCKIKIKNFGTTLKYMTLFKNKGTTKKLIEVNIYHLKINLLSIQNNLFISDDLL